MKLTGTDCLREKSAAIANAVRAQASHVQRFDIGYGLSGFALFFYQRYLLYHEDHDRDAFFSMVDLALARANDPVNNGFTYIDLTELYYFLNNNIAVLEEKFQLKNLIKELEPLLLSYAINIIQKGWTDPYTGGFLQAHYFLEENVYRNFLTDLIDDLLSGKVNVFQHANGTKKGYTSITHGLAFYLLFFVRCYEKGINTAKCLQLIKRFTTLIQQEEQDAETTGSYFNDQIGTNRASRLNLCYGDAGVVYAILRSLKYNDGIYSERKANQMLSILAARRDRAATGITGNDILYGNAGILFYFRHLKQLGLIKAELAEDAIRFWNEKNVHELYRSGEVIPRENYSFLEGETGACYLHMCSQTGVSDRYIRTITYMS